jgi:hypothetical protein
MAFHSRPVLRPPGGFVKGRAVCRNKFLLSILRLSDMSEFQYYEFAAIDKPLTTAQMAALRERSSRATITPNSFTNHYEWGNLKGDPLDWMWRYFDAHVYVANWCTCWLFLKLPKDVLDARTLHEFTTQDAFTVARAKEHVVLQWGLAESDDYDRFAMEDGSGWMARLTPLRDEMLRGDLRALYLGWLAGVSRREVDDESLEPPPPPGLSRLSGAQQSLVKFLEIDEDLLAAVAASEPQTRDEDDLSDSERDAWLERLPADEKAALLKLLLCGQGVQAERQLKSAYLSWQRGQRPVVESAAGRRSVAALWELAEAAAKVRRQQEAARHQQAEAERNAKRAAYLRTLAENFERYWKIADGHAQRGVASGYDAATSTLADLAEAYALCATDKAYQRALATFMLQHGKRTALVRRLVQAGLWEK